MSDSTPIRLNIEDLEVSSYATGDAAIAPIGPGGYCCTGCVSGCGINPTAGGCASGGGVIVASADYRCMVA
jgi:hypothetical protein